jgi:hypothetical protein
MNGMIFRGEFEVLRYQRLFGVYWRDGKPSNLCGPAIRFVSEIFRSSWTTLCLHDDL